MNINTNAKRILCYGDSNTWGWVPNGMGKKRFDISKRWTGILQSKLGTTYEIIEEGLGGRTTQTDDLRPDYPERNGLISLPLVLESHLPLDIVLIMLGTTELKDAMNLTAEMIGEGIEKLILKIQSFKTLENTNTPKIVLIVPPIIIDDTDFAKVAFKGGTEKSKQLISVIKNLGDRYNLSVIDSNNYVKVDQLEGIHITQESHSLLAQAIYEIIVGLF